MDSPFTRDTLRFLRALKRNNKREWFQPRRAEYERHVKAPMLAIIERLADDFTRLAPEMLASPKSLYRIYRDTRFSEDKTPYKTQVSASFWRRRSERGQGAGLYFEVGPSWTWMGGGFYAPETPQLVRIREHVAATYPRIHRIVHAAPFKTAFGQLDGERLVRVPRGYAKDDAAADYLKYRSFLGGREFPAEFATSAAFYPALVATFRAALPLVRFLNEALEP